jgi:GT2 family glycosyltransferase
MAGDLGLRTGERVSGARVWVVVLNWNGKEFLGDCLRSLAKQTESAEILVVDNGSHDGSQDYLRKEFPTAHLLELPENRGFAGGVNAGIEKAIGEGAEYIALINNDATADTRWLERLLDEVKTDDLVGIVASKMLAFPDKARFDSTGDFYSTWGFSFPRGRGEKDEGQYDGENLRDIFAASGGASLYRASMLREIGLFDEDFFAYYEDVDISFRARLQGWLIRYQPEAVVWHRINATSDRISGFARYHTIKNFTFLYTKNMPGRLWWKYLPLYLAGLALLTGNSLRKRQFGPLLRGIGRGLLLQPKMIGKRIAIQRTRTVSATQIERALYHGLPPIQRGHLRRLFGRA